MTKEKKLLEETEKIGDIAGKSFYSENNLNSINFENPSGTPPEFLKQNFLALYNILKSLNTSDSKISDFQIVYEKSLKGEDSATVIIDGEISYYTEEPTEIAGFHSWEENLKKHRESQLKKMN